MRVWISGKGTSEPIKYNSKLLPNHELPNHKINSKITMCVYCVTTNCITFSVVMVREWASVSRSQLVLPTSAWMHQYRLSYWLSSLTTTCTFMSRTTERWEYSFSNFYNMKFPWLINGLIFWLMSIIIPSTLAVLSSCPCVICYSVNLMSMIKNNYMLGHT